MKICTFIVLFKAHHNDVITKNLGKIRASAVPGKSYRVFERMYPILISRYL